MISRRRFLASGLLTLPLLGVALTVARADAPLNGASNPANAAPRPAREAARELRAALSAVRARFVGADGMFDYRGAAGSAEWKRFQEAAAGLRGVDLSALASVNERKAFWINVYNALVADAVIRLKVKGSVTKSPGFFTRAAYAVAGEVFNLEEIEHGLLRDNRPPYGSKRPVLPAGSPKLAHRLEEADPRIHFALNCGARSCPAINVYEPERLDQQLDAATRAFVNGPDVRLDLARGRAAISALFQWYAEDFGSRPADQLRFIARHLTDPAARRQLEEKAETMKVTYLPYDWSLNDTP